MDEKKLTDEEIVKAWEICTADDNAGCIQCPYAQKKIDCVVDGRHYKDTLDLIHRLQDENADLREENAILKGNPPMIVGRSNGKTIRAKLLAFDKMKEQNAELQKQVDELKDENIEQRDIHFKNLCGYKKRIAELEEKIDELRERNAQLSEMADYDKGHKEGYEHGERTTAKEILQMLHNIGGCDATDEWSKGWDKAIDTAYEAVKKRYGVEVE